MKYSLSVFLFFMAIAFCIGQDDDFVEQDIGVNKYPEGVYLTFESFLDRRPSNKKRVEARDLLKPKQPINDPLIDNCYFNYKRKDKRVKDAFAISYEGSLYLHVKSIKKLMVKKDRKQRIDYKDSFIRVVDQGMYLYLEGYFFQGGGLGFAIGSGPISVGTGGPEEVLKGVIFDYDREQFDLFRDCKDFNAFLSLHHRDMTFECDEKSVPIEWVREIMFEIN